MRRKELRAAIHRVDHENVIRRRRSTIKRRVYSVPHPNFIWHIDSNHKLIKWRFVTHAAVDGFSRTIVYAGCANNNRADTVLTFFKEGVSNFGLPESVRTDHESENVDVWRYMIASHFLDYGCVITGCSTHNERVERMWRDINRCVGFVYS